MDQQEFSEQVHLFSGYFFEELNKVFESEAAAQIKSHHTRAYLVSSALCSARLLAIYVAGLVALDHCEPGKEGLQEEIEEMVERIFLSIQTAVTGEIGKEAKRLGFVGGALEGFTWTINRRPPRPS
jgi:hypothetical protein